MRSGPRRYRADRSEHCRSGVGETELGGRDERRSTPGRYKCKFSKEVVRTELYEIDAGKNGGSPGNHFERSIRLVDLRENLSQRLGKGVGGVLHAARQGWVVPQAQVALSAFGALEWADPETNIQNGAATHGINPKSDACRTGRHTAPGKFLSDAARGPSTKQGKIPIDDAGRLPAAPCQPASPRKLHAHFPLPHSAAAPEKQRRIPSQSTRRPILPSSPVPPPPRAK